MDKTSNTLDLRNAGLKVTLPRLSILEVLAKDDMHLSADDIYLALKEAGNDVSIPTIYRVLTQFEEAGLVKRHHFDGGQAVFELDTGDNHDHIVCVRSGRVAEFKDQKIEKRLQEIAEELGYSLTDHSIVLYGVHKDAEDEDG